jgi:hypothetical protein
MSANLWAHCPRCGRGRFVRHGRPLGMCFDCIYLKVNDGPDTELTGGRWVREGLVSHWVEDRCHCGAVVAGQSCETCIRWAEKDARLHAEAAQSWANRHVIWDVLALRNEREKAA